MLGANPAVWRATQVIRNNAVRPSPAGKMFELFVYEPSPTIAISKGRLISLLAGLQISKACHYASNLT